MQEQRFLLDIVENNTSMNTISSLSKAEGIDLKGSDYDQMIVLNSFRVHERLNDNQANQDNISLVMVTNDTKPGFTRLKLVKNKVVGVETIDHWFETVGDETYISSKHFREQDLPDGMVIHGPCQSTACGKFDNAKCFRYKEWITQANQ